MDIKESMCEKEKKKLIMKLQDAEKSVIEEDTISAGELEAELGVQVSVVVDYGEGKQGIKIGRQVCSERKLKKEYHLRLKIH